MSECVRYSKVLLENGEVDDLCLFYSNVSCRTRREGDQIERDLLADGKEMGLKYVIEWKDNPVSVESIYEAASARVGEDGR